MLPYALLMIKLRFYNERILECRGLEPTASSVTFRVLKEREKEISSDVQECEVSFLDYANRTYHTIQLNEFQIIRRKDVDDGLLDTSGFEIRSSDAAFCAELFRISRDYLDYIEQKLNPWEYERGKLSSVELAISLDTTQMWEKYLELDWQTFLEFYWQENRLEHHIISRQTVTHLYIGNQFCYHLFPSEETLERILQKSKEQGVVSVIVFSTMPEFMIPVYRERISQLSDYVEHTLCKLEVVINDFGIPLLIEEMKKSNDYDITMGVLLNKRKKDSRNRYPEERESSINAEFYQTYLTERFKISGISYEGTGQSTSFVCWKKENDGKKNILHLPLYQTNTSGFCTTYALCKHGDRSKQEVVKNCPHFCESIQIEYVENENIIYRFNSLFGESMKEINDLEYLREITRRDVQRLVIRR